MYCVLGAKGEKRGECKDMGGGQRRCLVTERRGTDSEVFGRERGGEGERREMGEVEEEGEKRELRERVCCNPAVNITVSKTFLKVECKLASENS